MNNLQIEKSDIDDSPGVFFNAETGYCEISGSSYMERPTKFYLPLINWLIDYLEEFDIPLRLNIEIPYFNSSSSRQLLNILMVLKKFVDQGRDIRVNWYLVDDDLELEEEVEDFEIDSELKINVVKNYSNF
jgi:hypothetical protein